MGSIKAIFRPNFSNFIQITFPDHQLVQSSCSNSIFGPSRLNRSKPGVVRHSQTEDELFFTDEHRRNCNFTTGQINASNWSLGDILLNGGQAAKVIDRQHRRINNEVMYTRCPNTELCLDKPLWFGVGPQRSVLGSLNCVRSFCHTVACMGIIEKQEVNTTTKSVALKQPETYGLVEMLMWFRVICRSINQ